MFVGAIVFVGIFALALAGSIPSLNIINGKEAIPHSYPFMVSLVTNLNYKCNGNLISPTFVLTDAHCIYTAKGGVATLGAHNLKIKEPTQRLIDIRSIIPHPNYNHDNEENDIALIELSTAIVFTEYIKPVLLPRRIDVGQSYVGDNGVVSGWGGNDSNCCTGFMDVLRYYEDTVISNNECEKKAEKVHGYSICLSSKSGSHTGYHDYGGPLLINGVLVGINTFSSTNSLSEPAVFTRVDNFLDWISETTGIIFKGGCSTMRQKVKVKRQTKKNTI